MKKILILASNPRKDLNLDREIRDLKGVIKRSRNNAQFEVEIELAVRPGDLQELLLANEPLIVHFCGHGTGEQGLVLQSDAGREQLVSTNALSSLFEFFDDKIECVLLNACYSEMQANAINEHINYVVGMSQEIRDDAAIAFATGFYRGLGYGKSIEQSYKLGCNAIQLQIDNNFTSHSRSDEASRKLGAVEAAEQVFIPEHLKPRLKKKQYPTPLQESDLSKQPEILPEIVQALQQEVGRKRYRDQARSAWDDFGQVPASRLQPLTQEDYRWRQVLLSKVNDSWIKGVLENSLQDKALIKLKLEKRSSAVVHSSSGMEELPAEPDDSFETLQATEIFEQMGVGRTLLILGEPGAGKTIALLKLAQRLIERTEQDLRQPIPVVFNLSSWASKRQTIARWLIEELKTKYQVSKALGENWVKQEQLILLLDGLDEVQAEYRNACVRALNQFIEEHGTTEIVACCRVQDYEALSERLKLRSAICIKPLSSGQVEQYLDEAGEQLIGLKTLLKKNSELAEFAQKPLILSIMSLAYQGYSEQELLSQINSTEGYYQRLFDKYIERMLQRRGASQQYSPQQTKRWLIWLAKRINQESQTLFLIEQLQPSYLENKRQIIFWKCAIFFTTLLIVGLIIELIHWPLLGSMGLIYGLIREPIDWPMLWDSYDWRWVLFLGLFLGLIVVLGEENIETIETFRLSWKKAKNGCSKALSFVPYFMLFYLLLVLPGMMEKALALPFSVLIFGLIIPILSVGLILTLICCLAIGLSNGLVRSSIPQKIIPNQGIKKSLANAVFSTIAVSAIIGLIFTFLDFTSDPSEEMKQAIDWSRHGSLVIYSSSVTGLCFGSFFGLVLGGKACIKHFTLRLMLYCQKYIPWNYARFLNYATDRLFMQKVGGGYIFVHRMLKEHFAQMKLD